MSFLEEHTPIIIGFILGLILVAIVVLGEKAENREHARITSQCSSYMADAQNHSDSLHARIACDQLWADKDTRDAANVAAGMAAGAMGAAAAGSVK